MSSDSIFDPMIAMLLLTAIVWFYMYAKRIPAMKKARKPVQVYTTPDAIGLLPDEVNYPAFNFRNLLELPVLFYALVIYLYVSGNADGVYVAAAWVFFGFRVVHSLIHCTVNIVMARFYAYLGSALVLWFMLGRATLDIVLP